MSGSRSWGPQSLQLFCQGCLSFFSASMTFLSFSVAMTTMVLPLGGPAGSPPRKPAGLYRAAAKVSKKPARSTLPPLTIAPTRLPARSIRPERSAATGTAPGRLDDDLEALPEQAHRLDDLGLAHRDDRVEVPAEDRKGPLAQVGAQPVGDRVGRLGVRHDAAGLEGAARVVGALRLGPVEPRGRRAAAHRETGAAHQAAASDRRDHRVEAARLLQQLQGRRAGAGDDAVVVVGVHHREPPLLDEAPRGATRARRRCSRREPPRRRRCRALPRAWERDDPRRHHDDRLDPRHPRGQGQRLGVVAAGVGDHAALALGLRELGKGVAGAAELEGAHALKALALEEHAAAGAAVEGARGHHGRAVRDPGDAGRGRLDILPGGKVDHGGEHTLAARRGASGRPRCRRALATPAALSLSGRRGYSGAGGSLWVSGSASSASA